MAARRFAARAFAAVLVTAATPALADSITLDEALRLADQQNPEILNAGADVRAAEGQVTSARTISYNPELSVGVGPAFGGGETFLDLEVSLFQTVELGGKRGRRTAAARRRLGAATANAGWTRQLVGLEVRRAFYLGVIARQRVEATREAEAVATGLKQAADERLRLGAGTQLETNVATATLGRARGERLTAERRYRTALVELGAAVAAPAGTELEPAGDLPQLPALTDGEDTLVARTLGERRDLVALREERHATEADVALANALALPDVALGVSYARSGIDESDTVLFGLSVGLPLWNRNQGGRKTAHAAVERARVNEATGRREAERQVRNTVRSYTLARDAVAAFDRDVVERLGENLRLAQSSFTSGKIGLLDFSVVRRDLVDTRLAYLDALAELIDARYALELAAGGIGSTP